MSEIRRIALLMGQEFGYCRGVLRGIHAYAIQKGNWVFRDAPANLQIIDALREWKPHGIIAYIYDREIARRVLALRKPLVNTTNALLDLKAPLVQMDHRSAGRLAAEHFLQRGFKNFGYFGSAWTGFSKQREEGFRQALAEAGCALSSCYIEFLPRPILESSWKNEDRQMSRWLCGLPRPAAVLASNDLSARHLAEICRELGLQVPEDVALVGVDNDELECLLCHPPLSSVVNPAQEIGYQAAGLLDQLLSGQRPPQTTIVVAPNHIITRQSSDITAIADADVADAVAFIRDHLAERISVATVVKHFGTGRRDLERRFHRCLGRTMLQVIQRARIDRAKQFLAETDLPLPLVARRSGFSNAQRLAVVFRQVTGLTPTAYRRGEPARS